MDGAASLALLLRQARRRAGLTQERLADRAGLSVRAIRNLEAGRVGDPRPSSLHLLAEALGLDEDATQELRAAGAPNPAPSGSAGPAGHRAPADPRRPAPAQLPPDLADFTGRSAELARLVRGLRGPWASARVRVVSGAAGVGKTALAVHAAYDVSDDFPGGLLFAQLDAAAGAPAQPADVLAGFLRALGVDSVGMPQDVHERAAWYRSLLHERRVLVVLDDAAGSWQVRPLLPGSGSSAVIVTSRSVLALLDAEHEHLGVLDTLDAVQLVRRVGARHRPDEREFDEPAARAVVTACGGLPLAVRIAASRWATHPHWTLAGLADRLADHRRVLDELRLEDQEVRASIALSCAGLDETARRALRALATLDLPSVGAWVLGPVLDISSRRAEVALDDLVDAQLVTATGPHADDAVRYGMHDLVRAFARELAEAEDPADQQRAALRRAAGTWLAVAEQAERLLQPHGMVVAYGGAERRPPDPSTVRHLLSNPLAWTAAERPALLALIRRLAGEPGAAMAELARELLAAVTDGLEVDGTIGAAGELYRDVLAAVQTSGDQQGEAAVYFMSSGVHFAQNRYDEAVHVLRQAIAVHDATADPEGAASVRARLANVLRVQGQVAPALDEARAAVRWSRAAPGQHQLPVSLLELGEALSAADRPTEAQTALEEAVARAGADGNRRVRAHGDHRLGLLHHAAGSPDRAEHHLRRSLADCEALGDNVGAAYGLRALGLVQQADGRVDAARASLDAAVARFSRSAFSRGEADAWETLAGLEQQQGDTSSAIAALDRAVYLWRELRHDAGVRRAGAARAALVARAG